MGLVAVPGEPRPWAVYRVRPHLWQGRRRRGRCRERRIGRFLLVRPRGADRRTKETEHDQSIRLDVALDKSRANADRGPGHYSRLSFGGNESERFLRLGSAFVIAGPLPLALGIAADVYVVFFKISRSAAFALVASSVLLLAMLAFWYFYPMWLRTSGVKK